MRCPFCNLSEKYVLQEFGKVAVVFSTPRLRPGHLLVVPKRHVQKISELDDEERGELFRAVVEYQEKILKFASGCDVRQNFRPFIPDGELKVSHLHFHLLPREPDDDLYTKCMIYERDVFVRPDEKELKKYSDLLR